MKISVACLLLVLTAVSSRLAVAQEDQIFDDLSQTVQSLKASPLQERLGHNSDTGASLKRIEIDVSALRTKYINDPHMSDAYLQTLKFDLEQLNALAATPTSQENAPQVISDVKTDLDAKLKHARAASNIGESLGIDTAVIVKATLHGVDANGYDVQCNPLRWANSATPMFTFDTQTTPATKTLPPGYYRLRLLKDGTVAKTMDVSIGLDGRSTQTIIVSLR